MAEALGALYHLLFCAALAGLLRWLALEAREAWRDAAPSGRWALALLLPGLLAAGWFLLREAPLRGGYDNEHDFGYLAWSWDSFTTFRPDGRLVKEASPLPWLALVDLLGGRSLRGFLLSQLLLWALSAALVFRTMRRPGAGLLAAGTLAFSWLGLLSARSFSTTTILVFYLLCALLALARLREPEDEAAWRRSLLGFGSAALLVLGARYEFLPVLAWGFVLVLASGGWRRWRELPGRWAYGAAALVLCAGWALLLHLTGSLSNASVAGRPPLASALAFQLGEQNLAALGVPVSWALPLSAGLLALLALGARVDREARFWLGLLPVWALYFCVIFMPLSEYPLHFTRHHLYFFLPFVFLLAAAGSAVPAAWGRRLRWVFVPAFLAVYGWADLRAVRETRDALRTNDLEWQFLAAARRDWPAECRAFVPQGGARRDLLKKYFPFQAFRAGPAPAEGCLLIYRSPRTQVWRSSRADDTRDLPYFESFYGGPWREAVFEHRFYTVFREDRGQGWWESRMPEPVRLGFYRVTGRGRSKLLGDNGVSAALEGRDPEALKDFEGALALDPSNLEARLNAAVVLRQRGAKREALALLEKPDFEAGPWDGSFRADWFRLRGKLRSELGDAAGAERDAARAQEPPGPWRWAGRNYLSTRD